MNKILAFILSIGISVRDKEDTVLQKRFLVYQALLMSMGGIIWGILALVFNRAWQSSVPFGYVLLTTMNLVFFNATGNFKVVKTIQTAISLLLPFLFQWFLGGFIASGAVMLWALLSLAASVTYQSNRTIILWLVMFIFLAVFSVIFDKRFFDWIKPYDAIPYSIYLMVLNIIVISTIIVWLFNFMVRGKNEALQKLQEAQAQLVQSEKMATLGTLAAGVAHELNNPAAATRRAAQQLDEMLIKAGQAQDVLAKVKLNNEERALMMSLTKQAVEYSTKQITLDSLERSDREAEVEDWLDEKDFDNAWELAPVLVGMDLDKNRLYALASKSREDAFKAIIVSVAHLFPIHSLLHEIKEGSGRISEIVVALKNYSFLGQAPIQEVNIHEGIDNTLVILRSKMKVGVTVHREYCNDLPLITAYGSELNQVWTNILDNAIDAMKEKGDIIIRTKKLKTYVVVEIEDNGPGISAAVQSKIFDPFFTTKEPGKGTGLGLSTSYGIITEKHKGSISVQSKPGCTKFIVKLPINHPEQNAVK
jgi:signal transduction histidine kinase